MWETPETPFPATSAEGIERLQSRQKKLAVERAKLSKFFAGKLDHINMDRLDEAEEWRKIPILTKEQLRGLAPERFFDDFCIGARADVVEYWRSGRATGRPLFYPRSGEDMRFGLEAFRRLWLAARRWRHLGRAYALEEALEHLHHFTDQMFHVVGA